MRESVYRTMPFGKYKGRPLDGVPLDYLEWLFDEADLRPRLRLAIEDELERRTAGHQQSTGRRGARPDPAACDELVSAGLRCLAQRYHPDAGGSHDAMIRVTGAADWLRAQVRAVTA